MNPKCRPLGQTLLTCLALAIVAGAAQSQDRTALVIANADYGPHALSQVKADAAAVAETLQARGFDVSRQENLPLKELKAALEQFLKQTRTRGVAVIYFAGLAGTYPNANSKQALENHLQGAGKPADPKSPVRDSLPLAEIAKLVQDHSAAAATFLLLDVASPNPFLADGNAASADLVAIDPAELPEEFAVWLAAAPGGSRGDPAARSPFAAALAKRLALADESLAQAVEAVAGDVKQATGGRQQPAFVIRGKGGALASWGAPRKAFTGGPLADGAAPGQEWVNSQGMVFCWCPPGTFQMGSSAGDRSDLSDAKPVPVVLTRGFWLGKYEVTQLEAQRLGENIIGAMTRHNQAPWHNVSQEASKKLTGKLLDADRKAKLVGDGWEYGLPTEAEWEYACRAGTTTRYAFGDRAEDLFRYANYADKSLLLADGSMAFLDGRFDDGFGRALAPVGSFLPNRWGLHDMHGNVAEWCADRYAPALPGGTDPKADDKKGDSGVIRGGSWSSTAAYCESAFRNAHFSGKQRDFIGFRLRLSRK